MLGQDQAQTSNAFEKAAGAILGGLIKKSSSASGAEEVFESVQHSKESVLEKLDDILGNSTPDDDHYQSAGGGILERVFGEGQDGILNAIAEFLGLDKRKNRCAVEDGGAHRYWCHR